MLCPTADVHAFFRRVLWGNRFKSKNNLGLMILVLCPRNMLSLKSSLSLPFRTYIHTYIHIIFFTLPSRPYSSYRSPLSKLMRIKIYVSDFLWLFCNLECCSLIEFLFSCIKTGMLPLVKWLHNSLVYNFICCGQCFYFGLEHCAPHRHNETYYCHLSFPLDSEKEELETRYSKWMSAGPKPFWNDHSWNV